VEEDRKEGQGRDVDSFQQHTHSIVYLISGQERVPTPHQPAHC